jgi:HK97 family phage portal protein|tara:strand:+ start:2916 stop:4985 length:2070 start_codon:yes stop_codon:yes gene_type:complete
MATLLDNLKNVFTAKPEKKDLGNMVGYFGVGTSKSRNYKYEDLAEEGYMKNSIVYRCVNEIAKGASAVPFMVKAGDQVLDSHPIVTLLSRPNPLQSHSEFFNSTFGFLLLSGNAYILKVGSEVGAPKELHLLRPDRMVIKGGANPIPERYDYVINGRVHASYSIDERSGFSDVKHIKLWNPLDDYYGLSPMSAAALEVDQHNMAGKHNINLLSNGARPSGAVIFKPQDDAGISVNLSESQRQQLLTDLNNRFSGTANAGRPLLLEGDFDWKEMGLSPKDMDFLNLKHMSATDIAMCFGVPSQLVGVPDAQTYSNVAEARLALYEETIIPHLRKLESDLNEWLVPLYGENLEFCFDIDKIPALAERTRRIYENVTIAVREGIMTRNEAREQLGLSPMDGADDLYISATLFPLGSETTEKPDNPTSRPEIDAYVEDEEDDMEMEDEDEKALSDIDTVPTDGMVAEAIKGLEWRKEFGRGGTAVGVARAASIKNKERLSISTIKRMHSFFSRHEVDKQAEGFSAGEKGYPSAGRIAWALWGGDSGQSWARKKRDQIEREMAKHLDLEDFEFIPFDEEKAPALSARVKEGLKKKVDDHNEKYGDNPKKRTNLRTLSAVFRRGVGAYNTNPTSVRPSVRRQGGADRWAYARVNSYLAALRTGRFRGGKHDTDLFPDGHPLKSKGPTDSQGRPKK